MRSTATGAKVLEGADVEQQLRATVDTVVRQYVVGATEGFSEDWDLEQLWTTMNTLYPVGLDRADYEDRDDLDREDLAEAFTADATAAYDTREAELTPEVMRELERRVLLTVLDRKWREHLYEMDYLREGIGLRAMAQRDPLVEYQREGGEMFNSMMEAFMEEVVGFVFHLEVEVEQTPGSSVGVVTDGTGQPLAVGSAIRTSGAANQTNGSGRNGSGADGTGSNETGTNGTATGGVAADPKAERRRASRLIESGPDPDGQGVEVHAVDPDEATEEVEVPEVESAFNRPTVRAKGLAGPGATGARVYSAPGEDGSVSTQQTAAGTASFADVGRNAPCPCGSGRKFKMCHGRAGAR